MQFNCAKIEANSPTTTKALGTEKHDDDDEVKSSYLAICQFTTLSTLSCNNIYTEIHLESISNNFWMVRSYLLVCSGIITLHCIVWAAPGHPYIESGIALSNDVKIPIYKFLDKRQPKGSMQELTAILSRPCSHAAFAPDFEVFKWFEVCVKKMEGELNRHTSHNYTMNIVFLCLFTTVQSLF